jgi:nucleotide-binding universal stress UspA family protein
MDTILIATDLSPASHNASLYGVQLAKFLHAKVVLLHVCEPILAAADFVLVMTAEELRENSEALLRKEVQNLDVGEVSLQCRLEEGLPSETIKWVAKNIRANWIVIGMKGDGGAIRKIFGSTAVSLSRKPNVPLIVVPEDAHFAPPKTIALASDIADDTDVRIIDPLEELGIKCTSTMYVVRVIKKGMEELIERLARPTRVKWHCRELHPTFEFINDDDVAHAMCEFVEQHHIDMIAMIAHDHNLFERIFIKSNIKEMMFRSRVPLIILPGKLYTAEVDDFEEIAAKGHA